MLDAMVHLSGASMDSLDDNIGVDHVMCSRLIGGAGKYLISYNYLQKICFLLDKLPEN